MTVLMSTDNTSELPNLSLTEDLFGKMVNDYNSGGASEYIIRRDDGLAITDNVARYFQSQAEMPSHIVDLIELAQSPVLDIGLGAGQHSLVIQSRGMNVVGIDISPGAIELAKTRGIKDARQMDALSMHFLEEKFHTVLLFGSNLGIAANLEGLKKLLLKLYEIVLDHGQILVEFVDYSASIEPIHIKYQNRNTSLNRYPGSVRMRLEYSGHCSSLFDWLLVTPEDLACVAAQTGWVLEESKTVGTSALCWAKLRKFEAIDNQSY